MILFIIYMMLLIYLLFFAESYGRAEGLEEYRYVATNLVGNVIGFLPFGAILPVLRRSVCSFWKVTLLSFEFSALIEVTQLITKVGCFDVDDIILNTLGGMLGYGIFSVCDGLRRKIYG